MASLTLCCQPVSFITSSPSLGHVTPLMGDGCHPTKDSRVMALILTSRWCTITCHFQSVCSAPEQIDDAKRKNMKWSSIRRRYVHYNLPQFGSYVERMQHVIPYGPVQVSIFSCALFICLEPFKTTPKIT